jgi:diguanylate cyclase (GGDEF)-like protein
MKQRKTGGMLLVAALLTIILLGNLFLVIYTRRQTATDAMVINQLGIIRGMSQRVVKLVLAGKDYEQYVQEIDDTFTLYREKLQKSGLDRIITVVERNWGELEEALRAYSLDPSSEKQDRLITASEKLWISANASVFMGQLLAEEGRRSLGSIIIIIILELIFGLLLLFLIIRIVRQKLEPDALLDPLTGAYNRNVFHNELQDEIKRSERYAIPLSLITLDIDHFKKVNDSYGHTTGDRVLKELVKHIQSLLRSSDILCRTGGEEFGIIAPHTDINSARQFAEKIRTGIEQYPMDLPDPVTCSFGVALLEKEETWQDFYSRADEMLYRAKEAGRNRVVTAPAEASADAPVSS